MPTDFEKLKQTNVEIGNFESAGARPYFEGLLAPSFAFRRANGIVVDRAGFLDGLKPGPRRDTEVDSITLVGENRALVGCVVAMDIAGERKRFHNLRLYVREPGGEWKLLAWANEPI